MAALLSSHGFETTVCEGSIEACQHLLTGAAALLLTEEALELPQIEKLLETLKTQPAWSELPLIVLTSGGGEPRLAKLLDLAVFAAGSVTLLERPIGTATLLRSVEVALHSRRRQYQVRALLDQLSEQARLLDLSNDAILVRDREDRIVYWNRGAQEIYGYNQAEALGKISHELLQTQFSEPLEQIVAKLQRYNRWQGELVHTRRDGAQITVVSRWALDRNTEGEPASILETNNDVTERKQADEARARLAAIVQSSEDAIVSKDLNSIIMSWNRGAERVFGFTAEEAIGQPITIIIPADRIQEEKYILGRIRQGLPVEHYETVRRCKDGQLLDISLTVSPIVAPSGKVVGASKIARDITERKRAEHALRESEERYRILVAQVKDYAIFRIDNEGRPTSWNEGVQRVFGFEEAEFLGQNIVPIIFTPEDVQTGVPEHELREAVEKGTAGNDRWLRRKDGTRFFASGVTTALWNEAGKHIGYTKVVRDDTAAREAQRALAEAQTKLRDYAADLEETVAERTHDLRNSNEQLEAFVYSIAHDLRAPLRSMIGYSQILLDDHAPELQETAKHLLKRIQNSSEFMDKLLLDLLAYGRAGRAELELAPVEVRKAWETALFQCEMQIEQTHAEIEVVKPLPRVLGHEATLGQCLANLLNNALKFVAPGVRPQVRFWSENHGDHLVRLWVEDNGIGIPAAQQQRVFRVFERLHGSRYVGTGIGLSIVRKGVERMGGSVGLESEPGKGTRFWIELPKMNS